MCKFYAVISFLLVAVMLVGCTTKMPAVVTEHEITYTLNGVSLSEYVIVYDDADIYTEFAAKNFKDYLFGKFGITLKFKHDNSAEQQKVLAKKTLETPNFLGLNNLKIKKPSF